jgi:acetyl esterase/lipase
VTEARGDRSRHLVHPSLVPALEFIPPFATDIAGLADNRAMFAGMMELAPAPDGVERSEVFIPGLDGAPEVRGLLYRPPGASPRVAILNLHGGGFIMGHPEMSDPRNAMLTRELGCSVLSIDYRLAPENPWPAALDDALAAYQWIGRRSAPNTTNIVLLGESAGGGLAASLSHRLVELGQPLPGLQALLYPMLDPRSGHDGVASPILGEYVWTRNNNRFAWSAYLGGAEAAAGPAPGLASSLEGLPPTFILAGALDLFLDEDLDYARRLAAAGVPLELHVIAGAYHGFDMAGPSHCADQLTDLLLRALGQV